MLRLHQACALGLALLLAQVLSCSSGEDHGRCTAPEGLACLNIPAQCSKQEGCTLGIGCSAGSCKLVSDQLTCASRQPCRWTGTSCIQSETNACNGLDEASCGRMNGCVWGQACIGTLVPCDATTEDACNMHAHCLWQSSPTL
jgi:hypothetical protein